MKNRYCNPGVVTLGILLVGVLGVVAPSTAWAQAPQAIVQRSLEAHGRTMVTDIVATGTTTLNGLTKPTTVYVKPGRYVRIETGTGSARRTLIVNPREAWFGSDQRLTRSSEHQALGRPQQFPFLDLLSELNNPNAEITYHGLKTIGAASVHHLTIRIRDPRRATNAFLWVPREEQADFYIDAVSFLVLRSERMESSEESMTLKVPSRVDFSDYRTVQGVTVPFRIVNTMGRPDIGQHQSTTVFTTVTLNSGVADTLFSKR
jgi:hypothetical protein